MYHWNTNVASKTSDIGKSESVTCVQTERSSLSLNFGRWQALPKVWQLDRIKIEENLRFPRNDGGAIRWKTPFKERASLLQDCALNPALLFIGPPMTSGAGSAFASVSSCLSVIHSEHVMCVSILKIKSLLHSSDQSSESNLSTFCWYSLLLALSFYLLLFFS